MGKTKELFLEEQVKSIDSSLDRMINSFSNNKMLCDYFKELKTKVSELVITNGNVFDWNLIENEIDNMIEEDKELTNIVIDMNIRRGDRRAATLNVKVRWVSR